MKRNRSRGVSLLELMVTLVIVGIITSIAWPSYVAYMRRGDRVTATSALLEAQQFMERYYAANDGYASGSPLAYPRLPERLLQVPPDSPRYRLSLGATVSASSYTLKASPTGTDRCGDLTLTSTGVKGVSGEGVTVADCWK
ncbi:type IV pilin protein [Malikia sp.]|uniref:type IV pilin protein n=1 Tax=Malikia sp. TaxID=2070706 RepID=UPI00260D2DD2|nr:type IV pilin protein [Malikia sp.]MDD2729219.1 type IV pilin protein [Malikia sp.]